MVDKNSNIVKINFVVLTLNGPNADFGLISPISVFDGIEIQDFIANYAKDFGGFELDDMTDKVYCLGEGASDSR